MYYPAAANYLLPLCCMSTAVRQYRILWVDDEIDLLKPHILFLEKKGYSVAAALSGSDALEMLAQEPYDLVFLDENMPGLSGLETLDALRSQYPSLPVVMVTKSEEEQLMNQAIAGNTVDFLIKPVNPNQLLLTLKKTLQRNDIIGEATIADYQRAFRSFSAWSLRIGKRSIASLPSAVCLWRSTPSLPRCTLCSVVRLSSSSVASYATTIRGG